MQYNVQKLNLTFLMKLELGLSFKYSFSNVQLELLLLISISNSMSSNQIGQWQRSCVRMWTRSRSAIHWKATWRRREICWNAAWFWHNCKCLVCDLTERGYCRIEVYKKNFRSTRWCALPQHIEGMIWKVCHSADNSVVLFTAECVHW